MALYTAIWPLIRVFPNQILDDDRYLHTRIQDTQELRLPDSIFRVPRNYAYRTVYTGTQGRTGAYGRTQGRTGAYGRTQGHNGHQGPYSGP